MKSPFYFVSYRRFFGTTVRYNFINKESFLVLDSLRVQIWAHEIVVYKVILRTIK